MKLFALSLASVVVTGVSAFAMPQWDGTYNCTDLRDNTQATATLSTKDNKLNIGGVGVDTGSGLPCDNATAAETKSGVSVRTASTCTDTELTNTSVIQQPSSNSDINIKITVTKKSDSEVAVSVNLTGKSGGSPLNTLATFDCRR